MKPIYRIVYNADPQKLQQEIITLYDEGYRAINITGMPISGGSWLVALMQYVGKIEP